MRALGILILGLIHIHLARCALVNRTIDSRFGDSVTGVRPVYIPSQWTDENCPDCALRPDRSRAFRETWAETTYVPPNPVSITMQFRGVAVYVFFLLANNFGPDINTHTEFVVTIDGGSPTPFRHVPGPNPTFMYQQLAFSRTGLSNAGHTLRIIANGDRPSYMAFDYAIYTYDDALDNPAPPPPPPPPPPASSTRSSSPPPSQTDNGDGSNGGGDNTSSTRQSTTPPSQSTDAPNPDNSSSGGPSRSSRSPSPSSSAGTGDPGNDTNGGPRDGSEGSPGNPNTTGDTHGSSDGADGESRSSSKTPIGAIVGGVLGGLLLLALIIFGVILLIRNRRRAPPPPTSAAGGPGPSQTLLHHDSSYLTSGPTSPTTTTNAGGSGDAQSFHGSGMVQVNNTRAPISPSVYSSPYGGIASSATGSVIGSSSGGDAASTRHLFAVNANPPVQPTSFHPDMKRPLPAVPIRGEGGRGGGGPPSSEATITTHATTGGDTEVAFIREQMSVMAQQIEILRAQRADPFETSEPPPGYQPTR